MALIEQTDQVAQALKLLVSQYAGKPTIEDYLSSFITQLQELEAAAFDVRDILDVDLNEGAQLDLVGRIVGQPRGGREDVTYQQWIKARVQVNKGSGTGNDLLIVAGLTVPAANGYSLTESFAQEVQIWLTGVMDDDVADSIRQILGEAKLGGVRLQVGWYVDEDTFQFSTTDDTITDAAKGFGDPAFPTVGGLFATVKEG